MLFTDEDSLWKVVLTPKSPRGDISSVVNQCFGIQIMFE